MSNEFYTIFRDGFDFAFPKFVCKCFVSDSIHGGQKLSVRCSWLYEFRWFSLFFGTFLIFQSKLLFCIFEIHQSLNAVNNRASLVWIRWNLTRSRSAYSYVWVDEVKCRYTKIPVNYVLIHTVGYFINISCCK